MHTPNYNPLDLHPTGGVYRFTTLIDSHFCKDSSTLLNWLRLQVGSMHSTIVYSQDTLAKLNPKYQHQAVISICRHGREYKGFVNGYWKTTEQGAV